MRAGDSDADVDIVIWKKIDDEGAERYHGLVEFARNLERKLGDGVLGAGGAPPADVAELARRLTAVCTSLRKEAYLPHWDYQAEHKLPIIPRATRVDYFEPFPGARGPGVVDGRRRRSRAQRAGDPGGLHHCAAMGAGDVR